MKHTVEDIRGKAHVVAMICDSENTELHVQWRGEDGDPCEGTILLTLDSGVVTRGTFHDDDAWAVTPCDATGERLILVPYERVLCVMTDGELETMQRCRETDERLLSYAR